MKVLHLTADRNNVDREMYCKIIIDVNFETVKKVLNNEIPFISYVHVANVSCNLLREAFQLTNSIDWYWGYNQGVEEIVKECRGTSVGDIIVKDDGTMFLVENFGFKELSV